MVVEKISCGSLIVVRDETFWRVSDSAGLLNEVNALSSIVAFGWYLEEALSNIRFGL